MSPHLLSHRGQEALERFRARVRRRGAAAVLGAAFSFTVILILVEFIGVGVGDALTRAPFTSNSRAQICAVVVSTLLVWLGITSLASRTNAYQRSPWPVGLLILVPVIGGLYVLGHIALVSDLLAVTPVSSLIGIQAFRVVGGIFLIAWIGSEIEKPWFCVWAGSIDVFIGLTALPLAWWASTGSPVALAIGVVWNLIGLLDFVVAMAIVSTDRTVLRDFFFSDGPIAQAVKPTVLVIFSYGVPLAAIIHVLSIRQLI